MSTELSVRIKINADGTAQIVNTNKSLKETDKSTKSLDKSLKSAAITMAGVYTAWRTLQSGLRQLSTVTALGDQFDKMSKRTRVSSEDLSRMGYAAELSGAGLSDLETSLKFLSKNMLDAQRGVKLSVDTFSALNVKTTDSQGKMRKTADVMLDLADAISKLDGDEKTGYAMQLLGRSGTNLLPFLDEGRKGIMAMGDEAVRLGKVVTTSQSQMGAALTDANSRFKGAVSGLKNALFFDLMPALTESTNNMAEFVAQIDKARALNVTAESVKLLFAAFAGWTTVALATKAIAAFAAGITVVISSTQLYVTAAAAIVYAVVKLRDTYKDLAKEQDNATKSQKAFFEVARMPALQTAFNAATQMRVMKENKIATVEQLAEYERLAKQVKSLTGENVDLYTSIDRLKEIQIIIADKMFTLAERSKALADLNNKEAKSVSSLASQYNVLGEKLKVFTGIRSVMGEADKSKWTVGTWEMGTSGQQWGGPGQMGAPSALTPAQQAALMASQSAPLIDQENRAALQKGFEAQQLKTMGKSSQKGFDFNARMAEVDALKDKYGDLYELVVNQSERAEKATTGFAKTVANQFGNLAGQSVAMFANSIGGIIRGAKKMEDVFMDVGASIIDMFVAMIAKAAAFAAINALTGGALSAAAGGGGFLSGISSALGFADGGIVPGDYLGQPRIAVVHAGEEVQPIHRTNSGAILQRKNEQVNNLYITVNASALDPRQVNWKKLAAKQIIPALKENLRDGARLT